MKSLYQRLLGDSYHELPEVLRRFHSRPGQATGKFAVVYGEGAARRLAAKAMRMPTRGLDQPVTLTVEETPDGENWTRSIGGSLLRTSQRVEGDCLLERSGPLTFRFDVKVHDRVLTFSQNKAWFIGIPLPRALAPQVTASAKAEPLDEDWHVTVAFSLPGLGTICTYSGRIGPE